MFDKSWNEWVNKEFITSLKAKGKLPNNLTLAQEQKRREFQKTDRVFPQAPSTDMDGVDAEVASTASAGRKKETEGAQVMPKTLVNGCALREKEREREREKQRLGSSEVLMQWYQWP